VNRYIDKQLYLSLMISFLMSFFVFKIFDNSFSLMRMAFAFSIFIFCFFYLKKIKTFNISYLYFLLFLIIFYRAIASDIHFIKLFFILSFFLMPILIQIMYAPKNYQESIKLLFKNLYFLQLFLSIFYCFTFDFTSRFSGYTNSATTYSIYLLSFFVGYIFTNKNRYILLHFLIVFFLIYISQTRSTILLLVGIYFLFTLRNYVNKHLKLISFLLLTLIMFLLPLTTIFSENLNLMNRYEDNSKDTSTLTRLSYFNNQVNALSEFNTRDYLFGFGIDENKKVNSERYVLVSVDQHNDFFVLLYDYGIIVLILFIYLIVIKINSTFSLAFSLVYFSSFYHNMLYDFWLIIFFHISSHYFLNRKSLNYAFNKKRIFI